MTFRWCRMRERRLPQPPVERCGDCSRPRWRLDRSIGQATCRGGARRRKDGCRGWIDAPGRTGEARRRSRWAVRGTRIGGRCSAAVEDGRTMDAAVGPASEKGGNRRNECWVPGTARCGMAPPGEKIRSRRRWYSHAVSLSRTALEPVRAQPGALPVATGRCKGSCNALTTVRRSMPASAPSTAETTSIESLACAPRALVGLRRKGFRAFRDCC